MQLNALLRLLGVDSFHRLTVAVRIFHYVSGYLCLKYNSSPSILLPIGLIGNTKQWVYTPFLTSLFQVTLFGLHQVYKSRWSLTKCLYLACRFCPLCLWPVVMYGFIGNHGMETCEKLVIAISVVFMLLVRFSRRPNGSLLNRPSALLPTMYIHITCMGVHGRQTRNFICICALSPCIYLSHVLVRVARDARL